MGIGIHQSAFQTLSRSIQAIDTAGSGSDLALKAVGDAKWVLIGEATHGTEEFYVSRAAITQKLIENKRFNAVIIEADWPSAFQINRYVRGELGNLLPTVALKQFDHFPLWMWRNTAMLDFIDWLKFYNDPLPYHEKVGVYGMDLYSLFQSITDVIRYLEMVDPEGAERAKVRYGCFDSYCTPEKYGRMAVSKSEKSCVKQVMEQLSDLQQQVGHYPLDEAIAKENYFNAQQNALLVKNAERYYRSLFLSDAKSWNVRDKHMADSIDQLTKHLAQFVDNPKVIVWAHNSHVGDARATQMSEYGELNLGQLMRERHGDEVYIIGYSTYAGTVMAATEWGDLGETKTVRNALPDSYEALFHQLEVPHFLLDIKSQQQQLSFLTDFLQRAIGVVYRPHTERYSHYFYTELINQFDLLIHFDQTRALQPLDWTSVQTERSVSKVDPIFI